MSRSSGSSSTLNASFDDTPIQLQEYRTKEQLEIGERPNEDFETVQLMPGHDRNEPYRDDPDTDTHVPPPYRERRPSQEGVEHIEEGLTPIKRRHPLIPSPTTAALLLIIFALLSLVGYQNRQAIPLPPSIRPHLEYAPTSSGGPHARSCLCPMTTTGQRLCQTYPPASLKRSRIYTGTNSRMKRVLSNYLKARQRGSKRQLKVGIMGGSVSACHGVAEDGDILGKECYGRVFGDWFNERLGGGFAGGGERVTMTNGAIGGMDSR